MPAKIIVVTSGKGGVGKTTTTAALGAGLAKKGHKTLLIDFDVGLRNLDLIMGCERRVFYDLINVIQGQANLQQAIIKDRNLENLYVLPASQTQDKDALTTEGVEAILSQASNQFDYILCDSPAGIEKGAQMAMIYAHEAIVVVNPEVSSVRDSDRIIGMLNSRTVLGAHAESMPIHLLVTRYDSVRVKKGEMLSIHDIQEILCLNLIGIIPEDQAVLSASNRGFPVVVDNADSNAAQAYMIAARALTEGGVEITIPESKKPFRLWELFRFRKEVA
ncbi:MAG: septum site-determining protein MinD [Marinospirillum sp.]|uniref:septum site-determining protein MinD n=1 Tax=Marinospirillum sp. TaxID=2183934 RepID=UPI001A07143C|nr:septum site-determining protein MinD [Marinospirillum sp.]MBE0508257.1 septum site-determining protein MinD [Marinospirillum sp.]